MVAHSPRQRRCPTMNPKLVLLASFVAAATTFASGRALAQTAERPVEESSQEAPPASTGFQLALRTGAAIPMGTAIGGANGAPSTDMSKFVPFQVPFVVDIGWKFIPNLFV